MSMPRVDATSCTTAGTIVLDRGLFVATLNDDHLPPDLTDSTWLRVGGVGGGCEAGESSIECALREAREELSTDVEVMSSPFTYVFDGDEPERHDWPVVPAPFACQHRSDYTGVLFHARIEGEPRPGDDVLALVMLPLQGWALLECSPTIADLESAGIRLVEARPLPREARLWVDPDEALRVVVPLVEAHPEVFDG